MNYDTMSVHELMRTIAHADFDKLPALESTLRSAVIREASVGRVAIKLCSSAANFDHLVVTHEEKPHEWNDYDLIPREVK